MTSPSYSPALIRCLGVIGMLGAPMLLVEGLLRQSSSPNNAWPIAIVELIYLAGFAASATGLYKLGITGKARRWIYPIQCIGLACAAIFTILEGAHLLVDTPIYHATDMGWPLSHVFMIVVGVATLLAGIWRNWRRFIPLACGLTLPVIMAVAGLFKDDTLKNSFGPVTTVCFGLLGYAVYTSATSSQ